MYKASLKQWAFTLSYMYVIELIGRICHLFNHRDMFKDLSLLCVQLIKDSGICIQIHL